MAKLKSLTIPLDLLVSVFREPGICLETTDHHLPEDAVCAGWEVNAAYRLLILHIHSETFPDIPEKFAPPWATPMEMEPPALTLTKRKIPAAGDGA